MKLKEYLNAEYNLRGINSSSSNFEIIVLDKLYGKKINIPEWYDNLKVDNSGDGGIDYVVIDIDGQIIPLLDSRSISKELDDILFPDKRNDKFAKKIYDENGFLMIDDLSKLLIKKKTSNKTKLKIDFIQSKSGNSIQERVLLKIKDTFNDLVLEDNYDSVKYSEKLKNNILFIKKLVELISINDGAIEINFNYLTINEDEPQSMPLFYELSDQIKAIMKSGFKHSHVNFNFQYGNKLIDVLESSTKRIIYMQVDEKDRLYNEKLSCIGLVELTELKRFISNNGQLDISLFDGNVRDSYTTSSSINRDIKETLKSEITINDFWWLNNGITIICKSLNLNDNKLSIEEPQLVNGLQSAVTIYKALESGDTINEHKKIMVKILVENNSDNIDTIIKTTNTQNPVDIYLLSSTKQIHRDIEKKFLSYVNGYYYDRRKNYYKNINKDKMKIFDIKYTFKTYSSIFLGIPSQVRTSTKTNFKNKHDIVFNNEVNKLSYIYSDILDRNIQKILRNSTIDCEFKKKNGVSIITYSLHLALIYTSLLKKTLSFTNKYIGNDDIKIVENLECCDKELINSINIINTVIDKYQFENKVYLARKIEFEEDIKKEIEKFLNNQNKEG